MKKPLIINRVESPCVEWTWYSGYDGFDSPTLSAADKIKCLRKSSLLLPTAGQGNVFRSVRHSVHGGSASKGGVCLQSEGLPPK